MALVTELAVLPLTALWLVAGNAAIWLRKRSGTGDVRPMRDVAGVYREAVRDEPGKMSVIGLAYALDIIFYFYVQSNLGVVTYTVLAQTKIFFTIAILRMRSMLGQLRPAQKVGLMSLFLGANLVALKDVATGVASAAPHASRALGIGGLLLSQATSALANVAYEKRLREPGDVWVRNVQLNVLIFAWLVASSLVRSALIVASGGTPPTPTALLDAFCAPGVWMVVTLKATSALLIAMTIKTGGNVLYAVSKPWPVVLATLVNCLVLGRVPSLGFIGGITLSVSGIVLYYAAARR